MLRFELAHKMNIFVYQLGDLPIVEFNFWVAYFKITAKR